MMQRPARLWIRPGWQSLAESTLDHLAEIGVDEVLEVREKLGALRITVKPQPTLAEAARSIVIGAQKLSLTVCDMCGEPGRFRDGAWRRTRCDRHADVEDP